MRKVVIGVSLVLGLIVGTSLAIGWDKTPSTGHGTVASTAAPTLKQQWDISLGYFGDPGQVVTKPPTPVPSNLTQYGAVAVITNVTNRPIFGDPSKLLRLEDAQGRTYAPRVEITSDNGQIEDVPQLWNPGVAIIVGVLWDVPPESHIASITVDDGSITLSTTPSIPKP